MHGELHRTSRSSGGALTSPEAPNNLVWWIGFGSVAGILASVALFLAGCR